MVEFHHATRKLVRTATLRQGRGPERENEEDQGMSEAQKKAMLAGLPDSAEAKIAVDDIQDAVDAADVKGGGRYGIRIGDRIGKRAGIRKVRNIRNIRKIGGLEPGNSWTVK